MPSCSVIGCGVRKSQNQPFLTLHRLPSNEIKKREWLERIGVENIKTNVKSVFICSLHFDENCIKKTLKVPRVQEDAVPSKFLARHAPYKNAARLTRNRFETTAIIAERGVSNLISANTATNNEQILAPVPGTRGFATAAPLIRTTSTAPAPATGCRTSEIGTLSHPHPANTASTNEQVLTPVPGTWRFATAAPPVTTATTVVAPPSGFGTPEISISANESIKIKKLEDKCESLKKKIKRLNEKVRRQKKKIAEFENIISDLS